MTYWVVVRAGDTHTICRRTARGSLHESYGHERLKRYHKSVLWPRTAVRRRHAARVGATGIGHVGYVLHIGALPLTFARKRPRRGPQRATADHQAQPRREHLAPRGEIHGSCRDLALHRHGTGTTTRRSTCSLSKNRPVAHQALHLQSCASCVDGDR